jgi:hypothetical protein
MILYLILGLLIGFYARAVFDAIHRAIALIIESQKRNESGVVRPNAVRATRNQAVDFTTETGGVRRMTPDEILTQRAKEREKRLKEI